MVTSRIVRRNKQFLPERKYSEEMDSLKVRVLKWIEEQDDGAVFGEVYKQFMPISPRHLREIIRTHKDMGFLRTEKCRCHSATIYYRK